MKIVEDEKMNYIFYSSDTNLVKEDKFKEIIIKTIVHMIMLEI